MHHFFIFLGKTLGFLLPAFIHIEKQVKPRAERNSPTVLVLAPTRELAQQIHREVLKYNYKGITRYTLKCKKIHLI
jgi:ATP-dependent RNA helicase DDX43